MPDITMCKGENCPLRDDCYRYTAKPDEYLQSWFTESPITDGKCKYLMNVRRNVRKSYISGENVEKCKEIEHG